MGIMDALFPKKSLAEDLLPRPEPKNGENDAASVQDAYGQPAVPVAQSAPAGPPPAAAPQGQANGAQPSAPAADGSATQTQPPGPTPATGSPGGEPEAEPLEAPLRDLFTENQTADPQLEALLAMVDKITAQDLVDELQSFSSSIGADSPG